MIVKRDFAAVARRSRRLAWLVMLSCATIGATIGELPSALAQPEIPDSAAPAPSPKKPRKGKPAPAKPAPSGDAADDAPAADAAPAAGAAGKVDAKALVQSGVKLLKQKDYLGALAVFRDAYQRFPSVKLLLNIGTTLKLLGRNAEAANAYQRYLDDPEADPARVSEVGDVVATLDRVLGRVSLTAAFTEPSGAPAAPGDAAAAEGTVGASSSAEVAPGAPSAEVAINGGEWQPLSQAKLVRVDPGAYVIAARREGFAPVELRGQIGAGESAELKLQLVALPPAAPSRGAGEGEGLDEDGGALRRRASVEGGRSRLGLMLRGHFHLSPVGAAALIGPTVDLTDRLEVNAGVLLGRFRGGYLGASFAVLPGRFRPIAAAGLLVVADDGARFAARAAAGLEVVVSRNLSVFAELGGEHLFNPPMTVFSNAFVPSAGVFGRL